MSVDGDTEDEVCSLIVLFAIYTQVFAQVGAE